MNAHQLRFVKQLAEYLCDDPARRSIEIEIQKPDALEWAKIRNAGPTLGYDSPEEAEKKLLRFLDLA